MTQAILTASNIIQDAIIGFMDLVKTLRKKAQLRAKQRATYKELSKLSDADLFDIGLCRGDIYSISRGNLKDASEEIKARTNNNLRGWV
jgi:uncharacterized protein YjiS (DUF1127 family)